jgi:hypothetical protein
MVFIIQTLQISGLGCLPETEPGSTDLIAAVAVIGLFVRFGLNTLQMIQQFLLRRGSEQSCSNA